jgi:hypothetical protein
MYGNLFNLRAFIRGQAGSRGYGDAVDTKSLFGSNRKLEYILAILYPEMFSTYLCTILKAGGILPHVTILPIYPEWGDNYIVPPRRKWGAIFPPQSGYSIVKLAMSMCKRVNIYGFSDGLTVKHAQDSKGIYYDNDGKISSLLFKDVAPSKCCDFHCNSDSFRNGRRQMVPK